MGKVDFIVNPSFGEYWALTPEAKALTKQAAEEVAAVAKRLVHPHIAEPKFGRGIEVEVGMEDGQMTGRVNSHDYRSHWFEFGTSKMAPRPFLQTAAETLGYKISAKTKPKSRSHKRSKDSKRKKFKRAKK